MDSANCQKSNAGEEFHDTRVGLMGKGTGMSASGADKKGKAANDNTPNRRGANYAARRETQPQNIHRLEREEQALEYRRQGMTYRQMAPLLGLSNQGDAYRLVKSAMDRMRADCNESAYQLRQQELDRLDGIWEGMYPLACQGDEKAASVCVKISARRAALCGLDRPQQIEHTVSKMYAVKDASPDCPAWPSAPAAASDDGKSEG